jgi:hypothetical protein
MRTVMYRRIAMAIKTASQSRSIFSSLFHLLLPWRPLGQYGASSHLMAASSGFWYSPAHATLGNPLRIAPAHRYGYLNGWRIRHNRSPPPPFSLTLLVAKALFKCSAEKNEDRTSNIAHSKLARNHLSILFFFLLPFQVLPAQKKQSPISDIE